MSQHFVRYTMRNHSGGMTLVEMLLAVTLFSGMMGAAGSLLQYGLRSQVVWGGVAADAARMERAFMRLDGDDASAQRFFGIPVVGTATRLELARVERMAIDGAPAAPEWVKVVYRIEAGGDQRRLVREIIPWRSATPEPPFVSDVLLPLHDGVFAFGRLDAEGRLLWVSTWDGARDGVPKLVRLTATIPSGAGDASAEIIRVFRNPAGNLPQDQP